MRNVHAYINCKYIMISLYLESCLESPYILMGEHSQWRDRNGNLLKCNFTELVSLDTYRIIPVDRDSEYITI